MNRIIHKLTAVLLCVVLLFTGLSTAFSIGADAPAVSAAEATANNGQRSGESNKEKKKASINLQKIRTWYYGEKKEGQGAKKSIACENIQQGIKQLDNVADIISDFKSGDSSEAIYNTVKTATIVLFSCLGFGKVAETAWGVVDNIKDIINAFNPNTPEASMTEVEKLEQKMLAEFEKVQEKMDLVQEDIAEMSEDLEKSTDRIISEIKAANASQTNTERIYKFFSSANAADFNYGEFVNVLFGSADPSENYKYKTAYVSKLREAGKTLLGADDGIFENIYSAFAENPRTKLETLYDAYLLENKTTKEPTVIRAYYDFLCAHEDIVPADSSAFEMTLDFAMNFKTAVYQADIQYLLSVLYLHSDIFNSEKTAVETRQSLFEEQLRQDLSYIFSLSESYFVGYQNGFGGSAVREVCENDSATFGWVMPGETVYLNGWDMEICSIFLWDVFNYGFYVNGEPAESGIIDIPDDAAGKAYKIEYKYGDELIYTVTLTVQDDATESFGGGSGTEEDPYLIANESQFRRIAEDLTASYRLIRDISLTGTVSPIGKDSNHPFSGSLDGNGFQISGINISYTQKSPTHCGLFGFVSGEIKNVKITNAKIAAIASATVKNQQYCFGLIVGENRGTLNNCHIVNSSVDVFQKESAKNTCPNLNVGGVVGINNGTVKNCSVQRTVISGKSLHEMGGEKSAASNTNSVYSGGIVGTNNGVIFKCITDSASSVTNAVVTTAKADKKNIAVVINSYTGDIYAQNKAHVSSCNTYSPQLKNEEEISDNGNVYKTANSATKIFVIKYPFNEKNVERKEEKLAENMRDSSLTLENAVLRQSGTASASFGEYVFPCGSPEFNAEKLSLTVDGSVAANVSSVISYGFQTYNSSDSIQTNTCRIIFNAPKDGEDRFYAADVDYRVGIKEPKTLELKELKSVKLESKEKVLINAAFSLTYTDRSVDTVVCENSVLKLNGKTVEGTVSVSSNEVGPSRITVSAFGVKAVTFNGTVSCDHNYEITETHPTTCTEQGYNSLCCTICGNVSFSNKGFDTVKAHREGVERITVGVKAATCYEEGYSGDFVCTECGYIYEKGTAEKKLPHAIKIDNAYTHSCSVTDCPYKNADHEYVVSEKTEFVNGASQPYFEYKCIDCGYIYKDDVNIPDSENDLPQVVVSKTYVSKDTKTAKVYIQLLNNPGFDGAAFGVKYDTRMKLTEIEEGELWKKSFFRQDTGATEEKDETRTGTVRFAWTNLNKVETPNGNLLILHFNLPDGVRIGDKFDLNVVYEMKNGTEGGFTNGALKNETLTFLTKGGSVEVVECLPGDVNGDNVVDIVDMVSFSDYMFYDRSITDIGVFKEDYADVNLDGSTNTGDLVDIMRYIVGGFGTNLLLPTFDLHLNAAGGKLAEQVVTVTNGRNTELAAPVREGYTFIGWYQTLGYALSGGEDGKYGGVIKYNSKQTVQTLYAGWKINSLTFKSERGELSPIAFYYRKGENNVFSYNDNVTDKFKRNYWITFVDEDDKSICEGLSYLTFGLKGFKDAFGTEYALGDAFDVGKGSYDLTAVWDGGTVDNLPDVGSRIGYTGKMYLNKSGSGFPLTSYEQYLSKNTTDAVDENNNPIVAYKIYVLYKANQFSVTFDKNLPSDAMEAAAKETVTQKMTYGRDAVLPSGYSLKNYTFTGWYADKECTVKLGDANETVEALSISVKDDVTVYAGWQKLPPGLYDDNQSLLIAWNDIIGDRLLKIENDKLKQGSNFGEFKSKAGNLILPDDGSVTSIGSDAFKGCTGLTSITLPESVTSIGSDAFSDCTGLTSITIPESVTSIGSSAFYGCTGLTSITIPSSVTSIVWMAFDGCTGLTSITIPESVTLIGYGAFSGCTGLTSIEIPDSITEIGSYAFSGCTGLTSIDIPDSITAIGSYAFSGCTGLTSIIFSAEVTTISEGAFNGCTGLTNIIIPNGVTSIEGSSVAFWSRGAFQDCTGLTSIEIPESVKFIGTSAFSGCTGLTSITVAENNTVYHSQNDCLIKTASKELVLGCENSVIPDDGSVTSIGYGAFSGCTGLTSITIPKSVTSICYGAFSGCTGLTSIEIPDGVTSIGGSAFSGCTGLTSIEIPDGVTSIGDSAFSGCTGLTSIEIPESVTSIGGGAFSGCTGLTGITIPNSVTSIGKRVFSGCTGLTSITIPNSVTSIVREAFYGCTGLTSITIPNSVTSIDQHAFSFCTGLTSITIPESVTSIGFSAFYGCTGLTSITIPNSVTSIGDYAFSGCTGLTSVTIPTIGVSRYKNIFPVCVQRIVLSDSVTSIGSNAFSGRTELQSVTVPHGVKSIGSAAFKGCTGLTEINFNGTKEEWNAIEKGSEWEANIGKYTIYCSNGNIAFNGYSISYKNNGGEKIQGKDYPTSYSSQSIDSLVIPELIYPTYSDYNIFKGWYTDEACTVEFNKSSLKNNPRDITLYAKWDLCTVYNSIDSTPWSTSGRVIIDWSNETDTNMLNHTKRSVLSNRYNNIDINNGTTEVIFIGKSSQTFTNLHLYICCFAKGQKLTLRFKNFSFTTNEQNSAIGLYQDNGVDLTIETIDNNSIKTSSASGNIIAVESANVTFTGSGTLNVRAGNGANAAGNGESGANGGIGVLAKNVTVDMTGSLNVYGGDGGNGAAGTNQSICDSDGNVPETSTTSGGNGGNGGNALECSNLNLLNTSVVNLVGGNGNNGGNGGSVTGEGSYLDYAQLPHGANGGNGGNGGSPIKNNAQISLTKSSKLKLQYGNGGNGGNGGQGGNAGWPKNGVKPDTGGNGGNAGCGGFGYIGGNSGVGGNGGNSFANYRGLWVDQIGHTGDGGKGNNGGDSFAIVMWRNGAKTTEKGSPGNGNRGGYRGGETGKGSNGKTPVFGVDRSTVIGNNGTARISEYSVTVK